MFDSIGDLIADNLGWILIGMIALLLFLIFMAASEQEKNKSIFMASCLKDKKQYECDVLWGQIR